jgi:AcrR family transcriptional regulator
VPESSQTSQAPRRYASGLRREQADDTRERILKAARLLFADRGYPATSVQEIAAEAGTAVQTIYASVGGKRALVLALIDLIDAEADVPSRVPLIVMAQDPREALALGVRLTRAINERCGDIIRSLRSCAAAEPDVAAAEADGMRRHRMGTAMLAHKLAEAGVIRPGVDEARAVEVISALTAPMMWDALTRESDWTFDEAERWILGSLRTLVLGDPVDSTIDLIREAERAEKSR